MITPALPLSSGQPDFVEVQPEAGEGKDAIVQPQLRMPFSFVGIEQAEGLLPVHVRNGLPISVLKLRVDDRRHRIVPQCVRDLDFVILAHRRRPRMPFPHQSRPAGEPAR